MPETAPPTAADDPAGDWSVQRFCRQFLQVENELYFPAGASLRQHAVQEYLYDRLFAPDAHARDAHGAEAGPPAAHSLRALKTLVRTIEDSIDDWDAYGVSDNLVTRLFELASSSVADARVPGTLAVNKNTVVYTLAALETEPLAGTAPTIAVLENRATLATGGTTGLRTWEAALHLGQYLCQHRGLVAGKRILELGAGTGYVSLLCAKHLQAAHCVATDGSAAVVDNLRANLRRNGLDPGAAVSPRVLWWGDERDDDLLTDPGFGFDVVLGADITFDERDMPALLATVRQCVAANKDAVVLIAATERNRQTFDAFVALAQPAFAVDRLAFPVPARPRQAGPFYSDAVPIHICQLRPHSA